MLNDYDESVYHENTPELMAERDLADANADLRAEADWEDEEYEYPEDDGQPTEFEEWQDYYGGDVSEYGTYGDYDNGEDW